MAKKEDNRKDKRKVLEDRLKKKEKEILENSRELNEKLERFKLEEVEIVARKIAEVIPGGVSGETFGHIMGIVAEYQKKKEEPFYKLIEMERQRRIMELQETRIDDPDWWAKASEAMYLGIEIPGMRETWEKAKCDIKKTK